jgi:3-oxoacyl-[acyl-carrier protein] reductase
MSEGNTEHALAERVAVVTGGTGAIGRAICRQLADAGARVACLARTEPSEALPPACTFFGCDITDEQALQQAMAAIVERLGAPQLVVSNAGITEDALLLRTSKESWQKTLDTNLTAAFLLSRATSRHLLRAKAAGRLIYISSVVAELGNAGQTAYAAAKAGLLGLMRSLARELGGRGVTVNAVAPGFIESPMTNAIPEKHRAALIAQTVLGRMGTPQEVASLVGFLCSPAAGFITGQVLRINGGLHI